MPEFCESENGQSLKYYIIKEILSAEELKALPSGSIIYNEIKSSYSNGRYIGIFGGVNPDNSLMLRFYNPKEYNLLKKINDSISLLRYERWQERDIFTPSNKYWLVSLKPLKKLTYRDLI